MTGQIPEADWKIFKELFKVTLERFCERVLLELGPLYADTSATHHERYLKIYGHIEKSDEAIEELFDNYRRSTAWRQIAAIHRRGLFTDEEYSRFSEETHEIVALFNF